MKIKEVIKLIEEKYPLHLKEEWDNCGLMVGDINSDVTKVLVTLDVTMKTIDEAIENGVNLIISHHPFIFDSLKNVTTKNTIGNKVIKLIKNDIAVYSMHTNLDIACDGLNDYLAIKLELDNVKTLDENKFEDPFIRTGNLKNEMTIVELTSYVKEKLKLENVTLTASDESAKVKSIAICSGAGKSFIEDAREIKADCYITGDMGYHPALDAIENNFNIIDAGHYGTERIVTELLKQFLSSNTELEIIESKTMINPLKVY